MVFGMCWSRARVFPRVCPRCWASGLSLIHILIAGLFRDQGRLWFAVCALASGVCAAMLGVEHALFIPLVIEQVLSLIHI